MRLKDLDSHKITTLIEYLELVKSKKLMDENDYEYWKKEIAKVLISQCKNRRLIDFGIGVKESDMHKYLQRGYIDKALALECHKVLPGEMKDLTK